MFMFCPFAHRRLEDGSKDGAGGNARLGGVASLHQSSPTLEVDAQKGKRNHAFKISL
jgi:hypothetical protein